MQLKDVSIRETKPIVQSINLSIYVQPECDFRIENGITSFQSNCLEPFVQFNTRMRADFRTDSEKDSNKLASHLILFFVRLWET